jgi:hypothetical protein
MRGRGTSASTDEGRQSRCVIVNRFQRPSAEEACDHGSGEGVASSDGVDDDRGRGRVSRYHAVRHQHRASRGPGQRRQPQAIPLGNLPDGRQRIFIPDPAGRRDHRQFLVVEFQYRGERQRIADQLRRIEMLPEVDVEHADGPRGSG